MLAIIGGSGLTRLSKLEVAENRHVSTPYGEPSAALAFGTLAGERVAFLARHGEGHTIPPHEINYRANIWALHSVGVRDIVSVASVGGIRSDLGPGSLLVPHQLIDYTYGRSATFSDGSVRHVDFTFPYSEQLRRRLLKAARGAGEEIMPGGTYAVTQGPRLETAAEIDRLERDGADIVGMTAMPEAVLARELDLRYAAIAVVVNHAAGRGASAAGVCLADIATFLRESMVRVQAILERLVLDHGD